MFPKNMVTVSVTIGKYGLCKCGQVKMKSYWIRVGPNLKFLL
jgi:hypothetical protein